MVTRCYICKEECDPKSDTCIRQECKDEWCQRSMEESVNRAVWGNGPIPDDVIEGYKSLEGQLEEQLEEARPTLLDRSEGRVDGEEGGESMPQSQNSFMIDHMMELADAVDEERAAANETEGKKLADETKDETDEKVDGAETEGKKLADETKDETDEKVDGADVTEEKEDDRQVETAGDDRIEKWQYWSAEKLASHVMKLRKL